MALNRLTILDSLPERLLSAEPAELLDILPGPTLIHLNGRRTEPLFVSALLHGNEDVGLRAIQHVLAHHQLHGLPRALSLFIGNVEAARANLRHTDGQPDFNRIWPPATTLAAQYPEFAAIAAQVTESLRSRGAFASIDLHNNTGHNPHYGCVARLDHPHLHLASLFSRTVVYFQVPQGVQTMAFAPFCPAVTCECGRVGDESGIRRAAEFVTAALHTASLPTHPVAPGDVHLFRSVAVLKVPQSASLSFGAAAADLQFRPDFDWFNFRELAPGTVLGHSRQPLPLRILDEHNHDVAGHFVQLIGSEIRLLRPVMPAMLTLDERVIRQDCLGYLMERLPLPPALQ